MQIMLARLGATLSSFRLMKFRFLPLITSLCFALAATVHANDAEAIEAKLRENLGKLERGPESEGKAKALFSGAIKEIDTYVKATPEPKDAVKARVLQAQLYNVLGEKEKAQSMLPDLYKAVPKGKDGDFASAVPLIALQVRGKIDAGDRDAAEALLVTFEKDFAEHPKMAEDGSQMVKSMRHRMSLPSVGQTMDIAFTAIDGTKVDLAAMKGKVVLVDFWATWCGPCVGEMPNVKKAYAAYHAKGFEVVGISLDQDEDALRAFIKKNEIPWAQSFDGKGWENGFATKFGIQSIPATFLIGKDGKIAAADLRGAALEDKLGELLK
jgi:thiol-disulfide isomerase/thioredoxin